MEIKIIEERPNPLLQRTEYRFEISHTAASTPTRESVRAELAKSVKATKERVVIERMGAKFGTPKTVGEAMVYTSVDAAKSIVREHILLRNKIIEKVVKTDAPAADAPAPEATPAAAPAEAEKPKEA